MIVQSGTRQVEVAIASSVQLSTDATVVASGSEIDATAFQSISYTIKVATNGVKWSIHGANIADYSDEVALLAATNVAAAGISSYSATPAPYRFYRSKIIANSAGNQGTATINGIAK